MTVVPRLRPAASRRTIAPADGFRTRRAAARAAVVSFLTIAAAIHAGFGLALDHGPRRLRDPEYGKRRSRLAARMRDHPDRPAVAVVGSSRVAMGIAPGPTEPDTGPLICNMGITGGGPVIQLLTIRRLLRDGPRPAAVLVEYWPPFLRADGPYAEGARFDVSRLWPADGPTVAAHFGDPRLTSRRMRDVRVCPVYGHRRSLLNQTAASWLPHQQRSDASFVNIDPWGWQPGRLSATAAERADGLRRTADYYGPLFAGYEVSAASDRALRAAITDVRAAGIHVALLYLPEAAGFRALMPAAAARRADDHLAGLRREAAVPLVDARGWVADDELPDGFHLTRPGAAAVTARLRRVLPDVFPHLGEPRP